MASDSETLVKDWEALLKQAKEMQYALDTFCKHLKLGGNPQTGEPPKSLEFYAEQLKGKGDGKDLLVVSELLGRDVVPLVNVIGLSSGLDDHQDESEQREVQKGIPILSPAAQGIADGFERLLGGKKDPRMAYGKIPAKHQIGGNK